MVILRKSFFPSVQLVKAFFVIALTVHPSMLSQTTQWKGVSPEWRDSTNWTSGVPSSIRNTIISVGSGGSYGDPFVPVPAGGDTAQTGNFTVQSGASLFFEAYGLLIVAGTEELQNDGAITLGSGKIIFLKNITFFNGGSFNAGSGTLQFQGVTWASKSGSTFTPGTSTVVFEGSGDQSVIIDSTLNLEFYNLQVLTQATVTISGSLTVQNDCYVASGCTLNVPLGSSLFVNGTFTNDGVITGPGLVTEPLPVQLSSFSATVNGMSVVLQWTTATEVSNYGFDVERRSATGSFEPWSAIGFIQGAGTSSNPHVYVHNDGPLSPGRYAYRLKQIDFAGSSNYYYASEIEVGQAPKEFTLSQNYPNPFNPSTTIHFSLPEDGHVVFKLYDVLGRELVTLLDEEKTAGYNHQVTIDASRFGSGTYFCRLEFDGQQLTRKIVLAR